MQGEFLAVWIESYRDIWEPLSAEDTATSELYGEIYQTLSDALKTTPSAQELADITDNPTESKEAFFKIRCEDFSGERALVQSLERTYDALFDLAGDPLANPYFILLEGFISKFSLRYDLRRPCILCPTLPGVFSSLINDLKTYTATDTHLNGLMNDFDESLRDLRLDPTSFHIRNCFKSQVNLLEEVGKRYPSVGRNTLGAICNQLDTWPHETIKEAMRNLWVFACDYPGSRHSGTSGSDIRAIDMRDMVAVSILLAGFIPYMTNQLDANIIYRRS